MRKKTNFIALAIVMSFLSTLSPLGSFVVPSVQASTPALCQQQCGGNRCSNIGVAQKCVNYYCKGLTDHPSVVLFEKCKGADTAFKENKTAEAQVQQAMAAAEAAVPPVAPALPGGPPVGPPVVVAAADPCTANPRDPLVVGYSAGEGAILQIPGQPGGRVFVFDSTLARNNLIQNFGAEITGTKYRWIRWKDAFHPKERGLPPAPFDRATANIDSVEVVIKNNAGLNGAQVACVEPGPHVAPAIEAAVLEAIDNPCNGNAVLPANYVKITGGILAEAGLNGGARHFYFDTNAHRNPGLGNPTGRGTINMIPAAAQVYEKNVGVNNDPANYVYADKNPADVVVKRATGEVVCVYAAQPGILPLAIPPAPAVPQCVANPPANAIKLVGDIGFENGGVEPIFRYDPDANLRGVNNAAEIGAAAIGGNPGEATADTNLAVSRRLQIVKLSANIGQVGTGNLFATKAALTAAINGKPNPWLTDVRRMPNPVVYVTKAMGVGSRVICIE